MPNVIERKIMEFQAEERKLLSLIEKYEKELVDLRKLIVKLGGQPISQTPEEIAEEI